jgi:nucleoside phosphorylase
MSDTIRVESVIGKVDFAVITIRPDEYKAVLARLDNSKIVVDGSCRCEFATIQNANCEGVTVLVGRTSGQGHGAAQRLAKNMVVDFRPRWIVLVGIAGGFPNDDFSLGDVAIASRIVDLSVCAISHGEIEYAAGGGPLHPDVQNLVGLLPGREDLLGPWNEKESLNQDKPKITLPKSPRNKTLIGEDNEYKKELIKSLKKHFSHDRPPLFHPACLATSNTLVKDSHLVADFKRVARDIEHVEMEAGGVYHVSTEGTPLLSVRGISDIVGFKRDGAWTQFACNTAAAFFVSLISNVPRSVFGKSLATPDVSPTVAPSIPPDATLQLVDLQREMQRISDWLLQYELDEAERIEFAIEDDLFTLDEKQSVSLLLGPPGSGKTCLLAKLGNRFVKAGTAVLAIKADLFPHDKKTMTEWASTELNIGLSFLELVQTVSARETVVVLVDQLDALANTVDLTSSRLNEILFFIKKCSELPNVYVISSCRNFDYSYDSRFRRLAPKSYQLSLPTWEQVSEKLRRAGTTPEQIQPKLHELLRTPQHLSMFMRLKSDTTARTFETYSEMLGEFWNSTINTSAKIEFINRLTAKLVGTESIWTPLAAIAFDEKVVSNLCSEGLLERKNNQLRFSHQTIQEYAVARLFAESDVSLSDFVVAHQDTIFKRPTIWAVLSYLRDNAKEKYALELDSILSAGPRPHVKFLLIDFVCRQAIPTEYEIAIIGGWLADEELRLRILSAINNNSAWFEAFKHSHLPSIMSDPAKEQWPMLSVLINAWRFDWDGVFTLVKKHWSKHGEFDGMTLRVMERCAKWTPEVLSLIERVATRVKHNQGRSYQVESVVGVMSAEAPEDAARLAARVVSTAFKETPDSKSRYDSPLEPRDEWYDLEEIAKAAPTVFLNEITPWFVATAQEFHNGYGGSALAHYEGSCWSLDDRDYPRKSPILTAIQTCVDLVSKENPEDFVKLFRRHWQSENAVVHRIFIAGLMNVVDPCTEDVFEYLMSDDRRFAVGQHGDTQGSQSVQLINQLVPNLNERQRAQLTEKIQGWSKYKSEIEPCESQLDWDRESRLHLLDAIPPEFRSESLSEFIESEKTALPNWDRDLVRGRSGSVRTIPPMEQAEMETADENQLIDAFSKQKSDRSEWNEVEGGFKERGGGGAAADELSKLAESNPSRAGEVIRVLVSNGLTTHIHPAFPGFSSSEDCKLIFSLIKEISPACDESEEFRSAASEALRSHCDDDGLPEEVNVLLESWLAKPWDTTRSVLVDGDKREWKPESSFLWANGSSFVLDTDNSYHTLITLTQSLLNKNNPQGDRWITLLSDHLDCDVSYKTWKIFCRSLTYVRASYCSPEIGKSLIAKLFAKFPSLASETFGCRLLAMLARFVDPEFLKAIFDRLTKSNDEFDQQAAGELITLCALLDETTEWGAPLLEGHLSGGESPAPAFLVGIAHAAANLWGDLNKPKDCSRIIAQVIGFGNSDATNAIRRLFWNEVALPADEQTSTILKKLTEQIETVSGGLAEEVLGQLTEILTHLRPEILAFAQRLVETRFDELRRREFNAYEVGPYLVEIAMTLQRFDDTRSAALDLFETLLSAGLDEANKALKDVDEVDEVSQESPRMPRRRRRQRRKQSKESED